MIVYQTSKAGFNNDILTNCIDKIISESIKKETGKDIAPSELRAFKNSLEYMDRILQDREIPDDCSVSVEYHIPHTSKRVDLIITGSDGEKDNVIIVELKQWSNALLTSRDGIVETQFQGGYKQTSHPSYQAWSYASLLESFNATIEKESIQLHPCAYLHNYEGDEVITNDFYSYYLEKAPVFLKSDALKLRAFIKKFIKFGDKSNILLRIDNSDTKPSKGLADRLKSIMDGNKEFIMIDDQKVVYESAMELALHSHEKNKNVLIVAGGPGTGKSVVAVNLMVDINRKKPFAKYVTKTRGPRGVYFEKLRGKWKMVELKNLFVSSGSFIESKKEIQALIVDEAHRLTQKTGPTKKGKDQIKEIINAANFSAFFIDEDQRVHINDYGESKLIEKFATEAGATVHKMTLASQFRCNGSDGYLAWLDDVLQIRDTANITFASDFKFEFKVVSSPTELRDIIFEKNKINNKARLVAGYCWDWNSKKIPNLYDIIFSGYDFKMRWNLTSYGPSWIIDPDSVNEVGCIHTCQGLEVDYIGVIIGEDLIVSKGQVQCYPTKRSKMDRSIFGHKKRMKENPEETKNLMDRIIKNTYRVLMTRGMKGCYIYCVDKKTEEYFRARLALPQIN